MSPLSCERIRVWMTTSAKDGIATHEDHLFERLEISDREINSVFDVGELRVCVLLAPIIEENTMSASTLAACDDRLGPHFANTGSRQSCCA